MPLAFGTRVFAPSLLPTLLLLPVLALLVWLGGWQLERAADKRALVAAFDSGEQTAALPTASTGDALARYTRFTMTGRYRPGRQFLLENIVHGGISGYRVVTPFVTDRGDTLLVDRGWIPRQANGAGLPAIAVDDGPRTLVGRLDQLPRAGIALRSPPGADWPRILSFPRLAELQDALGESLYPGLVLLEPTAADGFLRDWRPGGMPPEQHVAYAMQWYLFAATLLGGYLLVSVKRRVA